MALTFGELGFLVIVRSQFFEDRRPIGRNFNGFGFRPFYARVYHTQSISREAFKDKQAAGRNTTAAIASLDEATARVAFVANFRRVHVGIQPIPRPAFPCCPVCRFNQFARSARRAALIVKDSPINALFPRVRKELAPSKKGPRIRSQKEHLFARPHALKLLARGSCGVVAQEQMHGGKVAVLHGNPRRAEQERLNCRQATGHFHPKIMVLK